MNPPGVVSYSRYRPSCFCGDSNLIVPPTGPLGSHNIMAVNMIKINVLFLNSIKIDFEFDIIIYVLVFSDHDDGGE